MTLYKSVNLNTKEGKQFLEGINNSKKISVYINGWISGKSNLDKSDVLEIHVTLDYDGTGEELEFICNIDPNKEFAEAIEACYSHTENLNYFEKIRETLKSMLQSTDIIIEGLKVMSKLEPKEEE